MRRALALLLTVSVVGVATWLYLRADRSVAEQDRRAEPLADPAAITPGNLPQLPTVPSDPNRADPDPAFREQIRRFLRAAPSLGAAARQQRAATLRRKTLARESSGALLPAESAYLQLALLRATISDPAELESRSQALLERYGAASERGWQAFREQPDPRHQPYREAEAELVQRAQDQQMAPDELRAELQTLRQRYYEEPLPQQKPLQ